MSDPVRVRALSNEDVASLRAMLSVFGIAFDEVSTYIARQPDDRYLEPFSRDTFVAIAAFAGPTVIGGLAPTQVRVARRVVHHDLAVDAPHRRRGGPPRDRGAERLAIAAAST